MNNQPEIRRSPRIRTWFETHFSSQRQEGEGVLADISYTGARVEDTGIQPKIGALAILYVCLPDDAKPFQLEGKIARHTDSGFAIEYERANEETRRGVDRIAELVGLPEMSPTDSTDSTDAATLDALDADPSIEDEEEISLSEIDEDLSTEDVDEDLAVTQPRETTMPHASELDLTRYAIPELEALAERIEGELAHRRDDAKRRVREEIEKLAAREGFSLDEVLEASSESDL